MSKETSSAVVESVEPKVKWSKQELEEELEMLSHENFLAGSDALYLAEHIEPLRTELAKWGDELAILCKEYELVNVEAWGRVGRIDSLSTEFAKGEVPGLFRRIESLRIETAKVEVTDCGGHIESLRGALADWEENLDDIRDCNVDAEKNARDRAERIGYLSS